MVVQGQVQAFAECGVDNQSATVGPGGVDYRQRAIDNLVADAAPQLSRFLTTWAYCNCGIGCQRGLGGAAILCWCGIVTEYPKWVNKAVDASDAWAAHAGHGGYLVGAVLGLAFLTPFAMALG